MHSTKRSFLKLSAAAVALLAGTPALAQGAGSMGDVNILNVALGLEWDPATCGALADEMAGLDRAAIEGAITQAFKRRFDLYEDDFGPELLALAAELEPRHEVAR